MTTKPARKTRKKHASLGILVVIVAIVSSSLGGGNAYVPRSLCKNKLRSVSTKHDGVVVVSSTAKDKHSILKAYNVDASIDYLTPSSRRNNKQPREYLRWNKDNDNNTWKMETAITTFQRGNQKN